MTIHKIGLLLRSALGFLASTAALMSLVLISTHIHAQEGSDVYIGKLNLLEKPEISALERVSNNQQYTNQPYFFNHDTLFFTQEVDDASAAQMDIFRFDLATKKVTNLTSSAESEYSPTPLPNGKGLSVIRVNAKGQQELWRLDETGAAVEHLVPEIEPVGYQVWLNEHELLLFVLGEPHTLQRVDIRKPKAKGKVIDRNIGASLYRFEESDWYLYSKAEMSEKEPSQQTSTLMAFNRKTNKTMVIAKLPDGSQYFSVTPTGHVITSDGNALYQQQLVRKGAYLEASAEWSSLSVSEAKCQSGVSRTSVSRHGGLIALVCPH